MYFTNECIYYLETGSSIGKKTMYVNIKSSPRTRSLLWKVDKGKKRLKGTIVQSHAISCHTMYGI